MNAQSSRSPPLIFASGRRTGVCLLIAVAILEAAAMAGFAIVLGGLISSQDAVDASALGMAAALAIGAGAMLMARQILGEWIGMHYINGCRQFLARHAIAVAAAGRPRRLGALAVRMSSDLTALRDWVSLGLSETAAAIAGFLAGTFVLIALLGVSGALIVLAACAPAALALLVFASPLKSAWRALRIERGRVSALAGDIVLSAATLDQFDVADREIRRLGRRGRQLQNAAVRRRALAAALSACAGLCLGVGALTALTITPMLEAGQWALLLLGLGFIAAAGVGVARLADAATGFAVARDRMQRLADQLAQADSDAPLIQPTAIPDACGVYWHTAPTIAAACAELEAMAFSFRHDLLAKGARARDVARWAPIVAPSAPLLRMPLDRNLSVRRISAKRGEIRSALRLVGLDHASLDLTQRLDPEIDEPDAWTQARLRLARAIVHRPRVVFIADALIALDPQREAMLAAIAAHTKAAIMVAASPA